MTIIQRQKIDKTKIQSVKRVIEVAPHISPSSAAKFLSCRRSAYLHLVRQLEPKKDNFNFITGTIWHAALDAWYTWQNKTAVMKAIRKTYKEEIKKVFSSVHNETFEKVFQATMIGMAKGYMTHYNKKDLKTWRWIKAEHAFSIKNIFGSSISFDGRIDGIFENKDGIWILENKTTKDLIWFSHDQCKMSLQTMGYMYAVTKTLGIKPKGVLWNIVRKPTRRLKNGQTVEEYCEEIKDDYLARPDFFFIRYQPIVTSQRILEWEKEFEQIVADLEVCYANTDNLDIWYKNPTTCGQYGGCEYFPLCSNGIKRSTLMLYKEHSNEN